MTELQEINEDIRICEAQIMFAREAMTDEWVNREVNALQARIEILAHKITEVLEKNRAAPGNLIELEKRRERLLKMKSINTDAAVRQLLVLQRQVTEMEDVGT